MATFKITAEAPTVYQLNSLLSFGMGYISRANGSLTAEMNFDTKDEAKSYLSKRAEIYNDLDPEGSEERLAEMMNYIDNYDRLRLDAVTAYIEEVEQ